MYKCPILLYTEHMDIFRQAWNKLKTHPDAWFFYGFLLTFTLSVRKVIKFYPLGGQFNEYSGIYLYLSDIFLFLTLLSWVITILYNNYNKSSSNTSPSDIANVPGLPCGTKMFHVEHFSFLWGGTLLLVPLLLVLWSAISLIWADNKIIAFFRSFKLAEFYLLYLYIIYIVPRGTILKRSFQIIIALGLSQAIIGIWQFIIQHSIGFFWLKESLISPDIAGVAKIIFHGEKFIRAYGLFPHPNILGGFLLISILLTWSYSRLFHVEHSEPHPQPLSLERRGWHFLDVPRGTIMEIILIIQLLALILTFSKSAIVGLFIAVFYISWKNIHKMFHVEHFMRKGILVTLIIILGFILAKPNVPSFLTQSLQERLLYLNVSRGTILSNPILGIGSGQFVLGMNKNVPRGTFLESWQFQPVHNVFLLIWSELGIIGLGLFIWFLWKLFHVEQNISKPDIECSTWNNSSCDVYKPTHTNNVPRGTLLLLRETLKIFKGALLGLIFIMLFDHYLWDIQQGQIMLWVILGIIAGLSVKKEQLD